MLVPVVRGPSLHHLTNTAPQDITHPPLKRSTLQYGKVREPYARITSLPADMAVRRVVLNAALDVHGDDHAPFAEALAGHVLTISALAGRMIDLRSRSDIVPYALRQAAD